MDHHNFGQRDVFLFSIKKSSLLIMIIFFSRNISYKI